MTIKITEAMKEAIRDTWRKGVDPVDIQVEYDISSTSLWKIVKGIPSGRRPGQRRRFDYAEAARLKANGLKVSVIAERMGVQGSAVRRALRLVAKDALARKEWKAAA